MIHHLRHRGTPAGTAVDRGLSLLKIRPTGKSDEKLSIPRDENISLFPKLKFAYVSPVPLTRGAYASSRNAGWDAVDAAASGAKQVAGRAFVRERSGGVRTNGAEKRLRLASRVSTRQPSKAGRGRPRTAKSCGPGARSWRQACGSVSPRPGMRREESARRRWQ